MFKFDAEAAREGSKAPKTGRVDKKGDYIVELTNVYCQVSTEKKTHGLRIEFNTEEGQFGNFDLWTKRANGDKLFGTDKVHAFMAILGLPGLTVEQRLVKRWCKEQGKVAEVMTDIIPELIGKKIGVVLMKSGWVSQRTGQEGYNLELVCPFNPVSKQTATEQMDNAPASELLDIVASLSDKPAPASDKAHTPAGIPPGQQSVKVENPDPPKEDLGEDIPW